MREPGERQPLQLSAAAVPSALSIGFFGSYALVVNNISGPGLLDFPHAFQDAGWLPCVVCICALAAASAAVASALADAHATIKTVAGGGENCHHGDLQFSDLFGKAFGERARGAAWV